MRQRLYELSTVNRSLLRHDLDYYQFPGYLDLAINGSPAMECETRLTRVLPQYQHFVEDMRRARICIVTRGDRPFGKGLVAHYAIRKYHEAMAAGCLVVGDLPDNQDIAQHVAVVIDEHMSMEALAQTLDGVVDDYIKGAYDSNIVKAYCAARTKYNYRDVIDQYMEPVLKEADEHFGRARFS